MVQNKKTYWVEYSYSYDVFDTVENEWMSEEDFDAGRFCCLKKDVKREVKKVIEEELRSEKYKNLKIEIDDCYITTDCEI